MTKKKHWIKDIISCKEADFTKGYKKVFEVHLTEWTEGNGVERMIAYWTQEEYDKYIDRGYYD